MSRFPGRPPGSPTPDHSDLFSNSFDNEDRLASFAEDFRQSLDADADEDGAVVVNPSTDDANKNDENKREEIFMID